MRHAVTRFAVVLLVGLALAIPASAVEDRSDRAGLDRFALALREAVTRILSLVVPRAGVARATAPAAFCGDINPDGCAESEAPDTRLCGHMVPDGCADPTEATPHGP